jgi:WD40 repeat protein
MEESFTSRIDDLLKEYLAFRGFTATLKQFEVERKTDKTKAHQTEKIVEQIFTHLQTFEYNKFFEYWGFLKSRFFSRLDSKFFDTVKKLENSLKKYYVIRCIQSNRKDKCKEFFEKNSEELSKDREWRDWFVLPFLNNPELHPELEPYMNKRWEEMLSISMHNFISTVIISIEKPELLVIFSELSQGKLFLHKKKLDSLQAQNEQLKKELALSDSNLKKLKKKFELKQQEPTILKCKPVPARISFSGHTDLVTAITIFQSRILTASKDKTVKIWSQNDGLLNSYDCGSEVVCMNVFEKNGMDLIVCGLANSRIKVLFIDNDLIYEKGEIQLDDNTQVLTTTSSNGKCVASTLLNHSIASICLINLVEFKMEATLVQDTFQFTTVALNHNGSLLLASNSNGFIKIIDMNNREVILEWKGHGGKVTSCFFSDDETTIFSIGEDGLIAQWGAHTKGKMLKSWKLSNINMLENPTIAVSHSEKYICLNSPCTLFEMEKSEPSFIFVDNVKEIYGGFSHMTWYTNLGNEKTEYVVGALQETNEIVIFQSIDK